MTLSATGSPVGFSERSTEPVSVTALNAPHLTSVLKPLKYEFGRKYSLVGKPNVNNCPHVAHELQVQSLYYIYIEP